MSAAQYLFTRCRDALPHKKGDQAHGRTPRLVRLAAIIAGAKAFTGKKVDWSKAVAFFKSIGKGVPARHVASHRLAYLKQRWRNFIKWGNIDDAPRSGRPPLLADAVAQRAAELVKAGQLVRALPPHTHVMKKVLFRSIPQAIRAVPELAAMCSEHNISSAQLLHAMQRVDPDLKLHTFHFKYAHTEKQLEVRQNYCREKVAWLDPMTAARRVQLERFVWWDEGTVQIGDLEHKTIKAWGSKEGLHSVDVLHLPSVKGQQPCKIHFIIAVSSHPAFHRTNGLVYFEFTTGTTHDKRLWNVYEGDEAGAHKYKVSNSVFTDCVAKSIITHQAVQPYCLQQPRVLHACLQPVSASKHHTPLRCCSSNSSHHCCWLLQVTLMHPHQPHTCIDCCQVACKVTFCHRALQACVHALPVAHSIHLHQHIVAPIVKVKGTMPHGVPHLMAPLLTAFMQQQQAHEHQLVLGYQRLVCSCPPTFAVHAERAPQV